MCAHWKGHGLTIKGEPCKSVFSSFSKPLKLHKEWKTSFVCMQMPPIFFITIIKRQKNSPMVKTALESAEICKRIFSQF